MTPVVRRVRAIFSAIDSHAERLYSLKNDATEPKNRVRRYRFVLRSVVNFSATRRWLTFLDSHPDLRRLVNSMPHMADKWHRPYLRADFGIEKRLGTLCHHYEFVLNHSYGRRLADAITTGEPIVTIEGKHGEVLSLHADDDSGRTKEGEVVLKLLEGEERIYTIAGTFVREEGRLVFAIGCMQGPHTHLGNEAVKRVTKAMHALRPREAMMHAIQIIAEIFNADGIVGVGSLRHVYRSRRKTRERIPVRYYDDLWKEIGGTLRPDGDYELPAHEVRRSIEEYSSNKRAEARRRYALKDDIRAQLTAFFQQK